MGLTKEQRLCIKFCANFGKIVLETLAMISQVFGEESRSCTWVFGWHAWFRAKSSQDYAHNSLFDINGIVHKEFVLAGQTVNSACCCDVLR
jgi:hypothetical protein